MDTDLVEGKILYTQTGTFDLSKPIFFKPKLYIDELGEYVNNFIENYNLISMVNNYWSMFL